MSSARKKSVRFVEPADEIEESAPPAVETRSRSKPRAAFTMAEAVFADAQACFAAYERSVGVFNARAPMLKVERPVLDQAAELAELRLAVLDAKSDEERLFLLQHGRKRFNRMASWSVARLERQKKQDDVNALAICVRLTDPTADVVGWNGQSRPSEFFGLRERAEARKVEAKAQPKMPFYPDKNTVPIMPGVQIDGLGKNHPLNANARQKGPRQVQLVSQGETRPKAPLMSNTDIAEFDSHSQRTLKDANGLIQNQRVSSGALRS
jgi:hypothetical protein